MDINAVRSHAESSRHKKTPVRKIIDDETVFFRFCQGKKQVLITIFNLVLSLAFSVRLLTCLCRM